MSKDLNKRTLEREMDNSKEAKNGKSIKKRKFRSRPWKGKVANDPVWHGKNSQIIKDICNIPFNRMLGFGIKMNGDDTNSCINRCNIISFFEDWFAGISEDFRSMLNAAATNLWTFIRGRNSGATNYQAADIFVNIILGCLDIAATANYALSFFGITDMYSVFNRVIPKKLFEERGMDYEDFITNKANYRAQFNTLMAKASAIVIPKQFPIYDWITSLNSNIYKDRDSETGREQLVQFVKSFFHIFDAVGRPTGGSIRLLKWSDLSQWMNEKPDQPVAFGPASQDKLPFKILLDILNVQINAIITDEDCNIIFGDLIKAYGGESSFWKITPVTDDYKISPVYSEEILEQIHNCTYVPYFNELGKEPGDVIDNDTGKSYHVRYKERDDGSLRYINNIYQSEDHYLVTECSFTLPAGIDSSRGLKRISRPNHSLLIDTNDANPSPEKVMNMTRLHNRYLYEEEENYYVFSPKAASAVILLGASICFTDDVGQVASTPIIPQVISELATGSSISNYIRGIALLLQADWMPIVYTSSAYDINRNTQIIGDVNNIKDVQYQNIESIHAVDFASLYDVPFTGKF